ncbi:MAG TPA: hypothetical protein VGI40_20255 [Pirellulaceae bacterium]|jgi:hypothetical protein
MGRFHQPLTAETYIRFVVGTEDEHADSLDGLFVECRLLRDDHQLEPHEADWLEQIYDWFNTELPCPPFRRRRFSTDAVTWFRSSAIRFITRMWEFAALLRDHGRPVRLLKTDHPGFICYEDPYQVVAEPWRMRRRRLRCRSSLE